MIELTVKTLDSQNHAFSVPDDTTVKQLKERIAESISFPVESQRLIYCGRVLQDEKNLSEYDVNGKVIHLVQRPPPQATRGNGGQQRSSNSQQSRRTNHHFRQSRMDGNAMYLGAMAFPADLMDAQGIQAPPSSHSLSNNRLLLAHRMLRRATVVLNRLENPSTNDTSDPDSPPEESQEGASAAGTTNTITTQAAAAENPTNAGSGDDSTLPRSLQDDLQQGLQEDLQEGLQQASIPFSGSIAQAAQAATAAAIAAAMSAAHAAGVPNITIVRSGQPGSDVVDVRMEGVDDGTGTQDQGNESGGNDASASQTRTEAAEGPRENTQNTETASAPAPSSTSNDTPSRSSDEIPRTTLLAELLDELNRINQRLQPYLRQYHTLVQDDPVAENNTAAQEWQRIFGSVSEIMHFLSHAYHALSDIMCDFSQPPPRALRCRPVLIQHSAVLQAGIPIQAQINVMTNRNNANNNNNISTNNNGNAASATANNGQANTQASSTPGNNADVPTSGETPSNVPAPEGAPSTNNAQEQSRAREGQEPAYNITPGNVEFFMEVGPGSITIDSLEATVVTNAGNMGSEGIQANVVGGSFPWGAPPPPEFIQNLMQAVAGHMIGRGGAAPSNNTTNQGGTGASTGAASSGQNSQARGNTATHPTTATQTRSTSRPHVHLAPATMQGLGLSSFDPFLPCNSHHILSRARQNAQAFHHHFSNTVGGGSSSSGGGSGSGNTSAEGQSGTSEEQSSTETQNAQSATQTQAQTQSQSCPPASGTTTENTTGPNPRSAGVGNTAHAQGQSRTAAPGSASSQSSTQADSQQSQQQSQQSRLHGNPPGNFLNFLSNMFSNMPTVGPGTTVNLGNLFQPMMGPRAGAPDMGTQSGGHSQGNSGSAQSSASGSASASASTGIPPGFPAGMAFFNLGNQPRFQSQTAWSQGQQQQQQQSQQQNHSSQQSGQQQSQQQSQQPNQQNQFQGESFFQPSNSSRDSAAIYQLFQTLSNMFGSPNVDVNVADLLTRDGQYNYQPGSLFMEFILTMAHNMNFTDIFALGRGNGESLNRIRPQLRRFVFETAFEGQPVTPASTARVVDRIIREMRPRLQRLQQSRLREDVDLVTTTIRYNQIRLPEVLSLLVEGSEMNLGQNLVRWYSRYMRELTAIILYCCTDGPSGFAEVIRSYVVELSDRVHPSVRHWLINYIVTHIQNYVCRQNVPFDEIRCYLVYRVPPAHSDTPAPSSGSALSNAKTESNTSDSIPEPMDTDSSPVESSPGDVTVTSDSAEESNQDHTSKSEVNNVPTQQVPTKGEVEDAVAAQESVTSEGDLVHQDMVASIREAVPTKREPDSPLPTLAMDTESLPDVVLGSEAWHNVLPSEWVPIIARDTQRQRKQNSQPPFSDAYLSGMPSKRRKVVTSTRPQGNLNQIITDSVRSALDEAGVRPVAGVERAGDDLELQAAYREQMRSAVQDSLANNPDFTPERFPNAAKFFTK